MICHTDFTVLNRRHHCRACGAVVCGSCSEHTIVLDKDRRSTSSDSSRLINPTPDAVASDSDTSSGRSRGPVRVCNPCFAEIRDSRLTGGRVIASPLEAITSRKRRSTNRSIDEYGFVVDAKASAERTATIRQRVLAERQKQLKRWNTYFSKHDSIVVGSKTVKKLVRGGIPPELRGKVWPLLCGAVDMRAMSPDGMYASLVAQEKQLPSDADRSHIVQIDKDLRRTFPQNINFDGPEAEGIHILRRILVAYSFHNPSVGYCQSINFIVGVLLLFVDEEMAFWMLCSIVENIATIAAPSNRLKNSCYYSHDLEGIRVDQRVFSALVSQHLPRVYEKLQVMQMPLETLTINWFLCLFVNSMPLETALRVWDCMFNEGAKVIFRAGLAMLKINERIILRSRDMEDFLTSIQQAHSNALDSDMFIKTCFDRFWIGSFPFSRIARLREWHLEKLQELSQRVTPKFPDLSAFNKNTPKPVALESKTESATTVATNAAPAPSEQSPTGNMDQHQSSDIQAAGEVGKEHQRLDEDTVESEEIRRVQDQMRKLLSVTESLTEKRLSDIRASDSSADDNTDTDVADDEEPTSEIPSTPDSSDISKLIAKSNELARIRGRMASVSSLRRASSTQSSLAPVVEDSSSSSDDDDDDDDDDGTDNVGPPPPPPDSPEKVVVRRHTGIVVPATAGDLVHPPLFPATSTDHTTSADVDGDDVRPPILLMHSRDYSGSVSTLGSLNPSRRSTLDSVLTLPVYPGQVEITSDAGSDSDTEDEDAGWNSATRIDLAALERRILGDDDEDLDLIARMRSGSVAFSASSHVPHYPPPTGDVTPLASRRASTVPFVSSQLESDAPPTPTVVVETSSEYFDSLLEQRNMTRRRSQASPEELNGMMNELDIPAARRRASSAVEVKTIANAMSCNVTAAGEHNANAPVKATQASFWPTQQDNLTIEATPTTDGSTGSINSDPTFAHRLGNLNMLQQMDPATQYQTCRACEQVIGRAEQSVFALDSLWHPHHFACIDCMTPLIGITYYAPDNAPHCESCYLKTFGRKCTVCGEPVLNGIGSNNSKTTGSGAIFHMECASCCTCGAVPNAQTVRTFVQADDDRLFCAEDYRKHVLPKCNKCQRPIDLATEAGLKLGDGQYHESCLKCSVASCGRSLFTGTNSGTTVMTSSTFPGSFFCESHLTNLPRTSQMQCDTETETLLVQLCQSCHEPVDLSGEPLSRMCVVDSRHYHIACIVCDVCQDRPTANDGKDASPQFYSGGSYGSFLCAAHFLEKQSPVCAACRQAITDLTVMKKHHQHFYHNKCFFCSNEQCNEAFTSDDAPRAMVRPDGTVFCPVHFSMGRTIRPPPAARGSGSTSAAASDSKSTPSSSRSSNASNAVPMCSGCHKPIGLCVTVSIKRMSYHQDCVKCSTCSTALGISGGVFEKDQSLFCKPCFMSAFVNKCHGCNEYITSGQLLNLKDSTPGAAPDAVLHYHPDCFKCHLCSTEFPDNRYLMKDCHIVCPACFVK
jgi:Rab-GTPase-TBC domain/FYVE zinc finger/LIM domain